MRQRKVRLTVILVLLAVGIQQGCGPVGPDSGCRQLPVNPNLKQIFYWGDFGLPNRGPEVGGIENPTWVAPGTIYVSTGYWREDHPVGGIFAIEFTPWGTSYGFTYRNFVVHESPHDFWTLAHDFESDRILFIAYDANGSWAGSLNFGDPSSEMTLVEAAWQPWGVAAWPGRPGIVFYGRDPTDGIEGFYWRSPGHSPPADSLLYAVPISRYAARGMAIDHQGNSLFFSMSGADRVQFLELPLDGSGQAPTVIAERAGGTGAIQPNPARTNLVLIQYFFSGDANNPPQSHIELLDMATFQSRELDVRTTTSACLFVVNDHASWSPDGSHLTFAAGGFSGEGDRLPMTLWVYPDAAFER